MPEHDTELPGLAPANPEKPRSHNYLPDIPSALGPVATATAPVKPTDLPRVPRPDVPDTTEQAAPTALDSFFGAITGALDNVVPDDLGGMITGESGWLANVPGYRPTIGAALNIPLTGGAAAVDAMTWGSEQMDHIGAWAQAQAPGGINPISWDEAHRVSYGAASTAANAQLVADNGILGGLFGMLINPTAVMGTLGGLTSKYTDVGDENPMFKPGFDILDPAQYDKAFHDSTFGALATGSLDAIWDVAADPTIVGGKASAVIRTGTRLGEFGGLSNQALRTADQVRRFGDRVDLGVEYVATQGHAGQWTAEAEHVSDLITKRPDQLDANVFVKSSSNPLLLKRLAAQVEPDDFATGAALVKASAGDVTGWSALRARSISLYDQLANGLGVDTLELLPGRAELSADQIAYGSEYVGKALNAIQDAWNPAPLKATEKALDAPEAYAAGQLITRGGNRVSAGMARAANAYRKGASDKQFGSIHNGPIVTDDGPVFNKPGWVSKTIEMAAGARPVRVLRWLGTSTPAGVVHLKGGDGNTALAEVKAFLQKSYMNGDDSAYYYSEFVNAATVPEKTAVLMRMERADVVASAAKHGISPDAAMKMYESYVTQRGRHLATLRAGGEKGFAVDEAKEIITTPGLYTELDESFPLLDQTVFRRVTHKNAAWLRGVADLTNVGDTINTFWKVSVLLRLGYTQRNVAEGLMRSVATMGFMASNPAAFTRLPANMYYYMGSRGLRRSLRQQDRALMQAHGNLAAARELVASGLDETAGTNLQKILDDIDSQSAKILETADRLRAKTAKRRKAGRSSNTMDDGSQYEGAFQGPEGEIAALISSADRTARMTFDTGFEARRAARKDTGVYEVLDPAAMKVDDAQRYWDEYALRLNQRYRGDRIIQAWMRKDAEGVNLDETAAWLASPEGAYYRQSMSTGGRHLERDGLPDRAAIDEYVADLWGRYNREIPKDTGLRERLLKGQITPAEAAASYGKRTPPAIPVQGVEGKQIDHIITATLNKGRKAVDGIMKALGSFPETQLVRHPFYDAVYRQRQTELYRLAREQGQDISSGTVKARVNKSAHADALRATRQTLYTIERVSNMATTLRWISPFFPAFENAIRTWGRIAYTNPAVLGYGTLLWNVPNSLGWVYDKEGNRVETSNMFTDDGNVIILPQKYQEFLIENVPNFLGINPGAMVAQRQAGYNVILPGAEPWWPGVGPLAQTAVALVLRDKPEITDILRSSMSEEMFRNIVPNGDPNSDLLDMWLSTTEKRIRDWLFRNTSEDGAYLTLSQTILEDAYIDAQIAGRTLTREDMKRVQDKVNQFYEFLVRSSLVDFTASSKYVSPYAIERVIWQQLQDDQSLSFQDKIKAFIDKTGGTDFLAVTRSGSTGIYGLQPNLSTWKKVYGQPDLVNQLNELDPELVGMFANMGSFDDPFSYSVYGEFKAMTIGDDGKPVKHQSTPEQLLRNNEITDGWYQWQQVTDMLNAKATKLGFSSINAKGAEQFKAIADDTEAQLKARFPAWALEKETYNDKLPVFIVGARVLIENAPLVNEDSTISALREYIQVRDMISMKRQGATDDQKKALNQIVYDLVAKLRGADIGFADLYDRYFARDDFREI